MTYYFLKVKNGKKNPLIKADGMHVTSQINVPYSFMDDGFARMLEVLENAPVKFALRFTKFFVDETTYFEHLLKKKELAPSVRRSLVNNGLTGWMYGLSVQLNYHTGGVYLVTDNNIAVKIQFT